MADPITVSPPPPVVPQLRWWVQPALGAYAMTIFAALAGASCFMNNETLRTTMFTAAVGLLGATYGFFFGSSAGSSKKDDTNAALGAALATGTPVTSTNLSVLSEPAKALDDKLASAT